MHAQSVLLSWRMRTELYTEDQRGD